MLEGIRKLSGKQLLIVWLLINIVLAYLAGSIMDLINALHIGVFNIYVFSALALLLVIANLMLSIGTRSLLFRLVFALSAVWMAFISVGMGAVNTVYVLLNFNQLAMSFMRVL